MAHRSTSLQASIPILVAGLLLASCASTSPAVTLPGGPLGLQKDGGKQRGPAAFPRPTSPDPAGGRFSLAQATAGLPARGTLTATIDTTLGTLTCQLHERQAPNTVANFVGLARGLRPFWDPYRGSWQRRPFYDGLIFHRVIPRFMIQGGCPLGRGNGSPGYQFGDEIVPQLRHSSAGILSMANAGPGTNGSQFFVLDAPAPHLDGRHTVFGQCSPTSVVSSIARVPAQRSRPVTDVTIRSVTITRR